MTKLKMATPPSAEGAVDLSVRRIRRSEFGKRLMHLLVQKGWKQSDLSRKTGLGRDSISQYVHGKTVPSPQSLRKMADVFKISPEELYPNYNMDAAAEEELPAFEFRAVSGEPDKMFVQMNIKIDTDKAVKIMQILNER